MFRREKKLAGTFQDVFDRALRLISVRDHSAQELGTKLLQRYTDKEVIDQVIAKCKTLGYLDEKRFAETFVRSLTRKGKSRFLISQGLKKKGVSEVLIKKELAEVNDQDVALELVKKKASSLTRGDKEEQRAKMGRYLQNRGFSYDTIQKVLAHYHLEE